MMMFSCFVAWTTITVLFHASADEACQPVAALRCKLGLTCSCARTGRYMADEARSLKAYGELPENSARSASASILALKLH